MKFIHIDGGDCRLLVYQTICVTIQNTYNLNHRRN